MTDRYQYRITVNGCVGTILDSNPDANWSIVAQAIEARGGLATLHRRFVTDREILPLLTDPTGWMTLGNMVVGPWIVSAELEAR